MPPKVKFKKEDIVKIAFEYVRENGWKGLTARYLSEQLNSSTMPIYSCFKSMALLEEEVVKEAMELYLEYLTTPVSGDVWIDHGVGYVMFALKEKYLFRSIFDEAHDPLRSKYSSITWERTGRDLAAYVRFEDLSDNQVMHLRRGRWVMMHGIATLVNTGAIPVSGVDAIVEMVKTASNVLFSGVKDNFD